MSYTIQEQGICDYVHTISRGLITLSPKHCDKIITLAQQSLKSGKVELCQFRDLKGSYEIIRTLTVSENTINEVVEKQKKVKPIEFFYLFKCYNADGNMIAEIHTLNSDLFQA